MSGPSPVSDATAAAIFGAAGREELLDGVLRAPVGRRRPVTRSRRPLVVALAIVAATATAGGAWALFGSSAHETTSIECSLDGTDTIIPAVSGDPAYDCAVVLKADNGTDAPPLAAYDNGHGGVTVIPRSAKPQSGWKPLPQGQDVALIQLQDSLDDYIRGLNSSCLDSSAATSLARSKLAEFGFTGWAVSVRSPDSSSPNSPAPKATPGAKAAPVQSTSGTRSCVASDIVDPTTQAVTLIPAQVATGPEATFEKLADRLRPLTQRCQSLPAAVASVRSVASHLGLSESARTYELYTVPDHSLRCATIYETVGGTIFVTVRGPTS
jgi:hypothetical protein